MVHSHPKFLRGAVDGINVSGDAMGVGALPWMYDVDMQAAWSDGVKNVKGGMGYSDFGGFTLNMFLNAGAGANFDQLRTQTDRVVTIMVGSLAVPAAGDPVYGWLFAQTGFQLAEAGSVALTMPFGKPASIGPLGYTSPWGLLNHAPAERVAANAGTSDHDYGAQTSSGGVGLLQIYESDGTVTFSLEDSAVDADPNFVNLLTFDAPGNAVAGEVKALGLTATVDRFTRWQLALGTATAVTFMMAFIRGRGF